MRHISGRFRATLIAAILFGPALVSHAGDETENHHYLVFSDTRHFYRNTLLGFVPLIKVEAHLLESANPLIDGYLDELTGGNLVAFDRVPEDELERVIEARGMFYKFRRTVSRHLRPDEESDFFDDRTPDFSVGPLLADLEIDGRSIDRGLMLRFSQVIVDDEKAYDLNPSAEEEYWELDLCVFDLDLGTLLYCAYGGDDELLLNRYNQFETEDFVEEADEIFRSPERRVVIGGVR